MAKFAIVATFEVAEGRVDKFLPLLLGHRDRCLKDEAGTLQFDVLRPSNQPNTVMLYEVYEDEAAFRAHWNGPHVARMRTETSAMVAKLSGIRCALLA